jgi:hypothetical protein
LQDLARAVSVCRNYRRKRAVIPAGHDLCRRKGVLMRIPTLMVSAILAMATVSAMPSARAQTYDPRYPVCLQIYQGYTDYYFECGYTSIPQCQMSASGRAAQCVVNPYYAGPKRRVQKRRRAY